LVSVYLFHVKTAPETPHPVRPAAEGLFDEPSISRQWVARRLQRALTVERWGGPARDGLSRIGGDEGLILAEQGRSAHKRALTLEGLIREIGAEPYPSWGIGAPTTRLAGGLLGSTSRALSRRLAHLIAEHTLSEYHTLEALVQDAPGVPPGLVERVTPMREQSLREFEALAGPLSTED